MCIHCFQISNMSLLFGLVGDFSPYFPPVTLNWDSSISFSNIYGTCLETVASAASSIFWNQISFFFFLYPTEYHNHLVVGCKNAKNISKFYNSASLSGPRSLFLRCPYSSNIHFLLKKILFSFFPFFFFSFPPFTANHLLLSKIKTSCPSE